MGGIKTYRDLRVWQKSIFLVKEIYNLTEKMPKQEMFCLSDQMRRSAISIPSNIAEGFRRQYHKEYKQFLHVALGSCAELETQVTISKELAYITNEKEADILEQIDHISRMIINLAKKL